MLSCVSDVIVSLLCRSLESTLWCRASPTRRRRRTRFSKCRPQSLTGPAWCGPNLGGQRRRIFSSHSRTISHSCLCCCSSHNQAARYANSSSLLVGIKISRTVVHFCINHGPLQINFPFVTSCVCIHKFHVKQVPKIRDRTAEDSGV